MVVRSRVVWLFLLHAASVTQGLVSRTGVDTGQPKTIQDRCRRSIPLDLAIEQQLWQRREPPISALVWFRGNHAQAARIVEQRARKIVHYNPWLLGTIRCSLLGRPVLEYEEGIMDPSNIDTSSFFQHFSPQESTVSRHTPIEKLFKATKSSFHAVQERQGPLWQITIAPCHEQPDQYFALGLSLSHMAGDGHVFIQLMSMLCSDGDNDQSGNSKHKHVAQSVPVRALNMERLSGSDYIARQAMGKDAFDFQNNILVFALKGIFGTIHRMLCIGKGREEWFLVDDEAMIAMKKAATATTVSSSSDKKYANKGKKVVEAVSTNDVLASWFFKNSGCTVGLLCVNYRGKLKGHSQSLGRNYWGTLVYRHPTDFDRSTTIHQSILTLQQKSNEVPSPTENPSPWDFVTKGSIAIATSWTRRKGHWSLPNCQEEVRLPLFDFASYCPSGFVVMRAFTPATGRTAVYIAGDARMVKRLKDAPFRSSEPLV